MKVDLDIIIPCYNSKKTLVKTLDSIKMQKDVYGFKVYLVNDNSSYNYSDEICNYSPFFFIKEIILDTNLGPGGARREGLNRSNSKYIMFIDSDDELYDSHSIYFLYSAALNSDVCISNFIFEREEVRVVRKKNTVWLHGKIYKRKFLSDNNITFNNSKSNEDNGFNRLVFLLNPNISFVDRVTYIYRDNKDSITRRNNREYKIFGLEGYIFNMIWAIEEGLKRDVNREFIEVLVTSVLVSMYYDYLCYIDDDNSNLIIKYSKDMLNYYNIYKIVSPSKLKYLFLNKEKNLNIENKKYEKIISFDEFVKMVESYND